MLKGNGRDFSDGYDGTNWCWSKDRNAEVKLKSKRILVSSFCSELHANGRLEAQDVLKISTQKNFAALLKEEFACKQKDIGLQTFLRHWANDHRMDKIIFLPSENFDLDGWQ